MEDVLYGTPYLLSHDKGQAAVVAASNLHDDVALLRTRGSLDEPTLAQLRREWRVKQVYESAGIEGNQLTLGETQIAIQRGITISGKPPEHSDEVRRLNEALDYLEQLIYDKGPLTEKELREIHALVLGRQDSDAGAYRKVEVAISNSPHRPPMPFEVPQRMHELGEWLASQRPMPPVLLAAVAHAWLVLIHPFRDGNGRTARAVMNLLLMRYGYPVVIIRRKDRQRYYEALRASDDGDITPLVELVAERCRDSLQQIDRARAATSGITLAVQRIQEQEERRYRIWADGVQLLRSTLHDQLESLSTQGREITVSVNAEYELPTVEDYHELCAKNPSGNSWLMKFRIRVGVQQHEFLLWIGYSSDEFVRLARLKTAVPTVRLSIPNPFPPPTWKQLDDSASFPIREVGYVDGKYVSLVCVDKKIASKTFDSVLDLVSEFVKELIESWFVRRA